MKTNFLILIVGLFMSITSFAQTPSWLWTKSVGGNLSDFGRSITSDAFGNVLVIGDFLSPIISMDTISLNHSGGSGYSDIFVAKYDQFGNVIWAKIFGTNNSAETGRNIITDLDGNIYISGEFGGSTISFDGIVLTNTGNNEVYITKLDPSGNVIWAKNSTTGGGNSYARSMTIDNSDNLYLAGEFAPKINFAGLSLNVSGLGGSDVFIVKIDSSGKFIWAKSANDFGKDQVYGVTCDYLCNVYITGDFDGNTIKFGNFSLPNSSTSGIKDIFIAKLDSAGNFLWAKSAGGNANDQAYGITTDKIGNAYITGYFYSPTASFNNITLTKTGSAGVSDIFITKYSSSGNVIWAKSAGGTDLDVSYGIVADERNNLYITGGFWSSVISFGNISLPNSVSPVSGAIFVAKYDSTGNILWAKSPEGNGYGTGICINKFGDIYHTGIYPSSTITFDSVVLTNLNTLNQGYYDVFIAKIGTDINVKIIENNEKNFVPLFPNPSRNSFSIKLPNETKYIQIMDLGGRILRFDNVYDEKELYYSISQNGIYFIQLLVKDKTIMQKFIISN